MTTLEDHVQQLEAEIEQLRGTCDSLTSQVQLLERALAFVRQLIILRRRQQPIGE